MHGAKNLCSELQQLNIWFIFPSHELIHEIRWFLVNSPMDIFLDLASVSLDFHIFVVE